MKIYTKTGDKGTTALFGGMRVAKDNLRIESYGTVDELNSILGVVLTSIEDDKLIETIRTIQNHLFNLGSDLATPILNNEKISHIERIDNNITEYLENKIDFFEAQLEPLTNFILPGGTKSAAFLHFARTVCRRAERLIVSLDNKEKINKNIVIYLNRLSDLLFVLARYSNQQNDIPDVIWQK